ncbi:MAG: ABC transporter substrate-binding protein [Vicinamibacteria bacterium]
MVARRRVLMSVAALACAPRGIAAQAPPRLLRVAILSESTETARRNLWALFRERLAQLGYVEGRTLALDWRHADDMPDYLPKLAAELVAKKPDVIVAVSTPAAVAAKQATSTIPIVFVGPADPVGSGLVPNLARPGGNVTGFSPMQAEIGAKWIELLRAIDPKLQRAAYLTDTGNGGEMRVFASLRERAAALGATVTVYDAVQPGALDRAFEAIVRDRNQGLAVGLTAAMLAHSDRIVKFAEERKLPAVYARRDYPDAGGLMSYGADSAPLYAKTADYVHRIATGTKPGDLPVERPMAVRMVVNRRAAKAQGITLPPTILVAADETIGE